jgi:hypothetical protein
MAGLITKPIIATEISYGLGNQMFQYAVARRLAHATNGRLILLFNTEYGKAYARSFGLKNFNIAGAVVRDEPPHNGGEDAPRMQARFTDRISWVARRLRPFPVIREKLVWDFIPEPESSSHGDGNATLFMPDLLNWRGAVRLIGYWQDERYFADIRAIIRKDFSLKKSLAESNRELLARIHGGPSAFIHVRRGDYLLPGQAERYGVCGKDYYDNAAELLRQRVGRDIKFFVFSDDPAWVRENKIGGCTAEYIDWNGNAPEQDLALMMECKHGIIANSSFSWWGAWLGETQGQIVIAPRIWYKAVPNYQDIVPERWLRL